MGMDVWNMETYNQNILQMIVWHHYVFCWKLDSFFLEYSGHMIYVAFTLYGLEFWMEFWIGSLGICKRWGCMFE